MNASPIEIVLAINAISTGKQVNTPLKYLILYQLISYK